MMDFFNILSLIGGVSLFLFGMSVMGQALERRAGSSLRFFLGRITDRQFTGFLTGIVITAVMQSSSATTVMVVGFVNSGMMTLRQSISVIMGANVGTTITSWILSLAGISSTNFFIRLLKPSSFMPVLALAGIIMYTTGKDKKRDTGLVLLGFSTMMFGMETMASAVVGLKEIPQFQQLFLRFQNPFLGVLVGAVITAIIQSSAASIGILQTLASTGLIPYGAAIPIIMGQNIGTCATAMISSIGTNKNAKRAALIHLCFNIIGTVVLLTAFTVLRKLLSPAILSHSASLLGIAVCHTIFNVLCAMILYPFSGALEKLACRIIPDSPSAEKKVELDERLLKTPSIALERVSVLMDDMAKEAMTSMEESLDSLDGYTAELDALVNEKEKLTDHYEDIIGTYLVKLSSLNIEDSDTMKAAEYLKMISDIERIADHSVKILDASREMQQKKIIFSNEASAELKVLIKAIRQITEMAYNAFAKHDLEEAFRVEPLEQVIDYLKEEIRTRHIRRLQKGECSIDAGFVLNDILTSIERVSDHCSNIAGCVIDANMNNLNLHETLNEYKHNSEKFNEAYTAFRAEYELP